MADSIKVGDYSVWISNRLKDAAKVISADDYSRTFILVDENTRRHCLPQLLGAVPSLKKAFLLKIHSGESFKTIDSGKKLWSELLKKNADRHSLLINLGGGVIGDMGGFVASTFKRGIPFVNLPTTLLAQVDASVGGKLGVDLHDVKNAVGVFRNPEAVFVYPPFLKTLSDDELLSGFAEMIKHALISSALMWNDIRQINPRQSAKWEHAIRESIRVKKNIVKKDPLEKNVRKVLNFGHTIGHAFESAALHRGIRLLHGHAVALGMIAESHISMNVSGLPEKQFHEITEFIMFHFGQYFHSDILEINWQRWITHDKKSDTGRLNFTLLESIGKPVINNHCSMQQIAGALRFLKSKL